MSYDIDLKYPDGTIAKVGRHSEGGTYVLGGASEASLNITWNYAPFYYKHIDGEFGIRWLYGKTGLETKEVLRIAVEELGAKQYRDYWAPTPGNAGFALSILLMWAKQHPEAVWSGN